jgi:5-methylcytosine-specific restriction endonuclease McrA
LALKHAAEFVRSRSPDLPLAYWNAQWRRDASPLLDELAACIDHIEAYSSGGAHALENFATACARCNARKSAKEKAAYLMENPPWRVKGKYGEPKDWDGLSSLFVSLVKDDPSRLTRTEQQWFLALQNHFSGADSRTR